MRLQKPVFILVVHRGVDSSFGVVTFMFPPDFLWHSCCEIRRISIHDFLQFNFDGGQNNRYLLTMTNVYSDVLKSVLRKSPKLGKLG